MTDRIHLAYCDQCGDEILEGDTHRVDRKRVMVFGGPIGSWLLTCRRAAGPTRYTCERCIAGEVRP
jgi:hypothetical protein